MKSKHNKMCGKCAVSRKVLANVKFLLSKI